jgi:Raf kinase inhibitor-like YbhB/YbcL family protein
MQLLSKAFQEGDKIPIQYGYNADNINPQLTIKGVPARAKSLALIMDDPDVPESVRKDRMWVHWVVFNMPPDTTSIEENSTPPGMQGTGTGGSLNYEGPCPPDREHRYFFKLYALDTVLSLKTGATKEDVEKAMKGHVLAETHLMGRYEKI